MENSNLNKELLELTTNLQQPLKSSIHMVLDDGRAISDTDEFKYVAMYCYGQIPESIPSELLHNIRGSWEFRDKIIKVCGFSVVTMNWVRILASKLINKRGLEIMAGSGALSKALKDCGISITCTDSYDWESKDRFSTWQKHFTNVENISAMDAVIKYGKDIDFIVCSWAPYGGNDFVKALNKLYEINPDCEIIYIGEEDGGCTADDEFFETYDITYINDVNEIYPQFWGIHDYVYYAKKSEVEIMAKKIIKVWTGRDCFN